MWTKCRVRIFCLGTVALSLVACVQPQGSKPFFFRDGYATHSERAKSNSAKNGRATIVVKRGDTLYSLARRNDTSVNELASLNRLRRPYALAIGQQLIVPTQQLATQQMAVPPQPGGANLHVVRPRETLYRISVNNKTSVAQLASLNGLRAPYDLAVGQRIKLPHNAGGTGSAYATGAISPPPGSKRQAAAQSPNRKADRSPRAQKVALSTASTSVRRPLSAPPARQSNSRFIWPVEGRVISRFGGKRTGLRNDGINIKIDEGAPVRAASGGIVTYAGNELRGYGNLLLVKHPGGYMTAYAHNSEILVRKGTKVNKGQVIASAGQTGNVNEPQLHFEIRRGSQAVNPEKYLGK